MMTLREQRRAQRSRFRDVLHIRATRQPIVEGPVPFERSGNARGASAVRPLRHKPPWHSGTSNGTLRSALDERRGPLNGVALNVVDAEFPKPWDQLRAFDRLRDRAHTHAPRHLCDRPDDRGTR